MVVRLHQFRHHKAFVVREHLNTHKETTAQFIKDIFDVLSDAWKVDMASLWREVKHPKWEWIRKSTGQSISTFGFDAKNSNIFAGATGGGKDMMIGYVLFDEVCEEGQTFTDKDLEDRHNLVKKAMRTAFRLNPLSPKEWEGQQRIKMTYNGWTARNEVRRFYVEPYIVEDEQTLLTYGKQFLQVPHFDGGYGLNIQINNFQVLGDLVPKGDVKAKWDEIHSENAFIKLRAKAEHIGLCLEEYNSAFGETLSNIKVIGQEQVKSNDISYLNIGFDYGLRDKNALTIKGWDDDFSKCTYLFANYIDSDVAKDEGTTYHKAIVLKTINIIVENLINLQWPKTSTVPISVDDNAGAFIGIMQDEVKKYQKITLENGAEPYQIRVQKAKREKQEADIKHTKIMMGLGCYNLVENTCKNLITEWKRVILNKDATRLEGQDHIITSDWYSETGFRKSIQRVWERRHYAN